MSESKNFTSGTLINSGWLNAIDENTFEANALVPGVTSANYRTVQSKLSESVSVLDFGVVGDGITPDDDAMDAALAAAAGHTLMVYGTPLLTRTLNITQPVKLLFDGTNYTSGMLGAHFKKDAALATAAVYVTAPGFQADGGGVIGTGVLDSDTGVWSGAAATGDGIHLASIGGSWKFPIVYGVGGNGIRLGNDAVVIPPISGMHLFKPYCSGNNGSGIYVNDINDNCNDCVIEGPLCQFNNLQGIQIGSGDVGYNVGNTLILDPHCESNGWGVAGVGLRGWNLYLGTNSQRTTVIGGDCEKGGSKPGYGIPYQDVGIAALSTGNVLINLSMSNYLTDLSSSTTIVNPVASDGTWRIPIVKFGPNPSSGEAIACEGTLLSNLAGNATAVVTLSGFGANGGAVLISVGATGYGGGNLGSAQALFLYGPKGGSTAVGGTTVSKTQTGDITISDMTAGAFTITNLKSAAGTALVRYAVSVVGAINSSTTSRLTLTVT